MNKIRLLDGSGREVILEERPAKLLVLNGKAEYVHETAVPEAAVRRPAPNYMRRHPSAADDR